MVLIISSLYDVTTDYVIEWLEQLNTPYLKWNTESTSNLEGCSLTNSKKEIKINGKNVNQIKKVWHRRGRLRVLPKSLNDWGNMTSYLKKEEDSLIKSLEYIFKSDVQYIGSYNEEVENHKIKHLYIAKEVGLNIPDSLVTTQKSELVWFHENYSKIISKDLRYPASISMENEYIGGVGTFIVDSEIINDLDEHFAPIFVQQYIEKQYEIRIFFFEDKLYPMAIFSQRDTKTKIDYRNYNDEKPNRCIPYSLPRDLKKELLKFISLSNLNTGSIDLIYSQKNTYVFLEVNPMGQFDWLSKNCNYYIERDIAKKLTE